MLPAAYLENLQEDVSVHTSPCDHGDLVWRHWPGPAGAPPLVLLHGGFGSWMHWVANIPALKRRYELWIPDLPGLGESAMLPEPHTAQHIARILLHGIDRLLGPGTAFDLAGFSFGALVGAELAVQAGSRAQHLLMCGGAGFGSLHVQVELMRPPVEGTPPAEARSIHHANLRSLMCAHEDTIDELALHVHGANLSRARFNSRKLAHTDATVRALPHVRARLSGIWGSLDATAGGRPQIEQRRQLMLAEQPEAGFHVLNGVGHWAMYEAPDRFNELLLTELSR